MIATISEYRDFVKVLKDQIITPDKNGQFWAYTRPNLTKADIQMAKAMGIKFYKNGQQS